MFYGQLRFAYLMMGGMARTIGPCKHFLPHTPLPPPPPPPQTSLMHSTRSLVHYTLPCFFPTFDMDKLGKIHQHHWKERVEIRIKLPCLKVIRGIVTKI